MSDIHRDDEPCFVISVAAKLVELHPQTLRYYDRIGLIVPQRTSGRIRLYSQRDVEELRKIVRLTEDLGVNLAGVEVIMSMSERIEALQRELAESTERAERLARENAALERRIQVLEGGQVRQTSWQIINVSAREVEGDSQEE